MCGFIGISDTRERPKEAFAASLQTIKHRGPDADGIRTLRMGENTLSLGHVRLSIIDPQAASDQPMGDAAGQLWIVFNGEIYNYKALRDELKTQGVQFRTGSDTEVLLHLYRHRGDDFVQDLIGMFSMAVVDLAQNRILLARDRFGKKPLYYSRCGDKLIFASEIKAVLRELPHTPDVNLSAMRHAMSLLAPLPPDTFFKDISKLAAGHLMVVENGKQVVRRYYDPLEHLTSPTPDQMTPETLESLLMDSVRHRLVSDVEVGVFLSGGLDSSLVTALYSRLSGNKIHTFSIGYDSHKQRYDETDHANEVAKHLGTEHHPLIVGPHDFLEALDSIVYHLDEPINDPASIPTFLLSRWVNSHGIKVCLSGEGSDEIFLGYSVYELLRRCYRDEWEPSRADIAQQIFVNADMGRTYVDRLSSGNEPYRTIGEYFCLTETEVQQLLQPEVLQATTDPMSTLDSHAQDFKNSDLDQINWPSYIDLKHWISEVLMMKVDKTAMAHAVEVRVPFLDHRVVQYAFSLPPEVKMGKRLLKQTAAPYLPPHIIERRKKGFSSPFSEWFFNELGNEILATIRKVNRTRNWFRDDALETHFERGRQGRNKHAIWGLYLIAKWCERYAMV